MSVAGAAPEADEAALAEALGRLAPKLGGGRVEGLRKLSGGASHETWAFRLSGGADLILRRAPAVERPGKPPAGVEVEAQVNARAAAAGAPVPEILHLLTPSDGAGRGYVMRRIEGETLPKRILRDPDYAPARARFAAQAGEILAALHRTPIDGLPLETFTPESALAELADRHRDFGQDRPVFSLAIRWLGANQPEARAPKLVHGDFRMGNLMLGPEGIRAVLDWELCHFGDPVADMGWLCMASWRFGAEPPVGGMGDRETLWAAYEAAGGDPVDPRAARWWEVLGALRWGVICEEMGAWVRTGVDRSVERHVIARRTSETELVLLLDLMEAA